ncbi:MAG: transketolase C-terminal domain-containing protein, partial [Lachnospiraceae bacterium]|nr:transketolase C-terminal domain-containing protein [Lachnospiraceae bacterium]
HYNDTHIGILDIPLLANIPNLTYLAPANKEEYISMLDWSIDQQDVPVAIRVPWTGVTHADYDVPKEYNKVSYKIVEEGEDICIIALGGFFELGLKTAKMFKEKTGITPTLINPRFITGIDKETLDWVQQKHNKVITIEDGILNGGFGSKVAQYYSTKDIKVYNFGFSMDIPKVFDPIELMQRNFLSDYQIVDQVMSN